jgi:hypothetical protein
VQIAHHEGKERAIRGEIGAEQDSTGLNARYLQSVLEKARRQVQHGDRLAHEWQCRWQALEPLGITGDRKMARPTSRSGSQVWHVHGQPLLQ